MTLLQLCKELGELAVSRKLVLFSGAGASLGELNPLEIDSYPVFFIIPAGTHTVSDNTAKYSLVLYYIERLLENNSNTIDIFSSAVENLRNIIIGARDIPGVLDTEDNYSIRLFMPEKLNDRLAGAYAEVRITTDNLFTCLEE